MQKLRKVLIVILLFINFFVIAKDVQNKRPMGVVLSVISYWSPQYMFKDAMKQSNEWLACDIQEQTWVIDTLNIPLLPNGYPTQVPIVTGNDSFFVYTTMLMDQHYLYPAGEYTLIFEGSGEVETNWDAQRKSFFIPDSAHKFIVNPNKYGICIVIKRSDINNPIRNIRVILPGFKDSYLTEPFHPKFLNLIKPFSVLRFMAIQGVNYSDISSWNQRITPDYYSQGMYWLGGISLEYIVQLCNTAQKDAWINIPHKADNNYIVQFATILRDSLNKNLNIYIEYANETWNSDYYLTRNYTREKGLQLGLSADTNIAGLKYTTLRSLQIFEIFDSVFATDTSRLKSVMSSQFGYLWPATKMLEAYIDPQININNTKVDYFACGPYFGTDLGENLVKQNLTSIITVEDILDSLELELQNEFPVRVGAAKTLVDSYNLEFITYEGGQHLVNYNNVEDSVLSRKLREANRHPRMRELYCTYYDTWYNTVGNLFMTNDLMTRYTNTSFGLLEHMEQDTTTAPKWMAHWDCVYDTVTVGIIPDKLLHTECKIYPNPASETLIFTDLHTDAAILSINDILGKQVYKTSINKNIVILSTNSLGAGIYFYKFINNKEATIHKGKFIVFKQ